MIIDNSPLEESIMQLNKEELIRKWAEMGAAGLAVCQMDCGRSHAEPCPYGLAQGCKKVLWVAARVEIEFSTRN
ncbi:MAG: hypothetical protein SVY53_03245 [Chloroflexota bacterium]|nr:hypothetical protein [Chloroflexota bacterium]